jgi:Mg2+ and Co2+ transporter CorA
MKFKLIALLFCFSTASCNTASCNTVADKEYLIERYNQRFANKIATELIKQELKRIVKLLEDITVKIELIEAKALERKS